MTWTTTLWNAWLPLQWGAVLTFTAAAAAFDARRLRIPNWLTGLFLLTGCVHAIAIGSWIGLGESLVAATIVSLPYLLLFMLAGGGGGDVKLMMGVGAWLGLVNGVAALFCVAAAGTIYAVALQVIRRHEADRRASEGGRNVMPYGPAIFLGVLVASIGTVLWRA